MVFLVRDEATRQFYVGLSAGSLFALPPALESLGLVGSKTEERAFLDKKLTEVYSPLHVMIVAMNLQRLREIFFLLGFNFDLGYSFCNV